MHLGGAAGEPEAHAAGADVEASTQWRHLRALTSQRVAESTVGDEAIPPAARVREKVKK
jgi:hypothetical protein